MTFADYSVHCTDCFSGIECDGLPVHNGNERVNGLPFACARRRMTECRLIFAIVSGCSTSLVYISVVKPAVQQRVSFESQIISVCVCVVLQNGD